MNNLKEYGLDNFGEVWKIAYNYKDLFIIGDNQTVLISCECNFYDNNCSFYISTIDKKETIRSERISEKWIYIDVLTEMKNIDISTLGACIKFKDSSTISFDYIQINEDEYDYSIDNLNPIIKYERAS